MAQHPILVDSQWLLQQLHAPDLRVVDARPAAEYQLGHIPGAVSIPVEHTFRRDGDSERIGHLHELTRLFGNAGVGNRNRLVIYDDGRLLDAARLFWVFEIFGHEQVALLHDGITGWTHWHHPTDDAQTTLAARDYVATVRPRHLATRYSTLLAIDDASISIIDARSEEEFRGEKSRAHRYGHIPRSTNIPAAMNFTTSATGEVHLKTDAQLKHMYERLGVRPKAIAYCNRGKESAVTYFVLRKLGYEVSAYDGAWLEWGNDVHLPIVNLTGAHHGQN